MEQKDNSQITTLLRTTPEELSAEMNQCGLDHVDVAALAQLYNSQPNSPIAREDLVEQARTALMKYELAEDEREIAAHSLARSMQMLLEQHGLKKLELQQMTELECDVLNWCGVHKQETASDSFETNTSTKTQ